MFLRSTIITINDSLNYGNRLQNYALNEMLSHYGEVDTAFCSRRPFYIAQTFNFFKFIFKTAQNTHAFRVSLIKRYSFNRFTNQFIPTKKTRIDSFRGVTSKHHAQVYVLGSDQIWNYRIASEDVFKFRLGSFASKSEKIITYAASFGISEVDDIVKPLFQKYLPRLKSISVREDRGAELVKEMTGLDATVVLDPTLMLTAEEWMKISDGFVLDNDKYVLTYFLGRPSDEQERDIQAYAKEHGCRVRRILDLRDKETYVAGPQDFVELFSKAQYVFTDSYHACCFSLLFHKQFTVFNRAGMTGKSNMNSRMETLFRLFDLNSVMMDSGLAPEIDYGKVDQLLEQHRKGSQNWLDKAMKE